MVNTLGEKKRKTRSDKKHSMRPTISRDLNERLNRLSYIIETPMKDVAEKLCKMVLITTPIIESLSPYFQREYWSTACVMYPGHFNNPHYPVKREPGRIRTTIRFKIRDYDQIERLAYALSITPHATASLLLETALQNVAIVNAYVSNHCRHALDEGRLKELKDVLRELNHGDEKISFSALISAIVEDMKSAGQVAGTQLREKLTKWLDE